MASGEIDIYGALRAKTGEGKVAFAAQIYDEEKGKFQSEINQEEGGGGSTDAVLFTPQTLTDAQKTQARTNIGAAASSDVYTKNETQQIVQQINENINIVDGKLEDKQDVLESGVNVKTINNQSILGNGNIEIGGGGAANAVLYTSQTLTDSQKEQARRNIGAIGTGDRVPSSSVYDDLFGSTQDELNADFDKSIRYTSQTLTNAQKAQARANIGAGDEAQSNKVTTIGSSSTDVQYPSAKAVYTAITNAAQTLEGDIDLKYKALNGVENDEDHYVITPLGINYIKETLNSATIVIDEGSSEKPYGSNYDPDLGWLYTVIFKTGSTPSIVFGFETESTGKKIVYPDDFSIEANRLYELSIMYVGVDVITNVKTYLLRIVDYTIPEITNGGDNGASN